MLVEIKKIVDFLSFVACSALIFACFSLVGCESSGKAVLPDGNLSAEQIEKLQADDKAVEDEESQGKQPKPKGKK